MALKPFAKGLHLDFVQFSNLLFQLFQATHDFPVSEYMFSA